MRTSNEYVARMLEYLPPEVRPLYAAAPDLLAALERITAGLNDGDDSHPLIRATEVKAARAAIAAARSK